MRPSSGRVLTEGGGESRARHPAAHDGNIHDAPGRCIGAQSSFYEHLEAVEGRPALRGAGAAAPRVCAALLAVLAP